jgi:hypothetical protein
VEDVLAGVLRMKFGKSEFAVPVLVIEKADAWRAKLMSEASDLMSGFEGQTNAAGVLAFLGGHTPTMIGLLRDYDVEGVLPDDEWIRGHATEPDVLRAFMLTMAASFPFIAAALDILAANPNALRMVLEEFGPAPKQIPDGSPTNTSPEPTAGPSNRAGRRSRTSSSRAI